MTRSDKLLPPSFDDLPDSAYVRLPQLVPSPLPWSPATLWRKSASGEFVKPVKLSERVTAWSVGAVRAWIAAQLPPAQPVAVAPVQVSAPSARKRKVS